jgi:hypothetical protein
MAVSRKYKRPISVDGRDYLWWVMLDDEPFVPSTGHCLRVVDLQGEMFAYYPLCQPAEIRHIEVRRRRFRSADRGSGRALSGRFRCPAFAAGPSVTPADVAALVRWCESAGEPVEVDYRGLALAPTE